MKTHLLMLKFLIQYYLVIKCTNKTSIDWKSEQNIIVSTIL